MGKIKNKDKYPLKHNPVPKDYVIGSDSENGGKTVNFPLSVITGGGVTQKVNITNNINFSWGRYFTDLKKTEETTKNIIFTDEGNAEYPCEVFLLIVDTFDWDNIKDKKPVLLLDRYKRREWMGTDENGFDSFRKAGFKHEQQEKAIENKRFSEVPLLNQRTVVDFKFENYFKMPDKSNITALGYSTGRDRGSERVGDRYLSLSSFNIGLRLRYEENDEIIETPQLIQLKVEARLYKPNVIGVSSVIQIMYKFI